MDRLRVEFLLIGNLATQDRLHLGRPQLESRPMPMIPARLAPILLLVCSNVFMTIAWYGHLKFRDRPLVAVILVSWMIAFFEYCLAVPANRIGSYVYSGAELKAMQEVITLCVFAVFSVVYLGQRFTLNHAIGFALIALGAFFVFIGPIGGSGQHQSWRFG
jgi:uncharacterized protein (DUF486 family)